ncbi:MAG: DUF3037 domain-containing protein [Azospira oryzae]|jgi:hypothetical protein|nr:MAG: DUF3037 domain-containing protein [Azospira oryzae]
MQELHLFEYAVVRVVPYVEREEFLNIGVVVLCAKQKFLQSIFKIEENRLRAFCPRLDIEELNEYITSFEQICAGGKAGGPIGLLPIAERFRWLTATRSTILQSSKVHPGLCDDPQGMLMRLHGQLVLTRP